MNLLPYMKKLTVISFVACLAGCVTTANNEKNDLYGTPSEGTSLVKVSRDNKVWNGQLQGDNQCPTTLSLNNTKLAMYAVNQHENYYLKPANYTFKAQNCVGTATLSLDVAEQERILLLSIDGHGHPMIVKKK